MWEMLVTVGKDLRIEFNGVKATTKPAAVIGKPVHNLPDGKASSQYH
jgi:hypothetical protein